MRVPSANQNLTDINTVPERNCRGQQNLDETDEPLTVLKKSQMLAKPNLWVVLSNARSAASTLGGAIVAAPCIKLHKMHNAKPPMHSPKPFRCNVLRVPGEAKNADLKKSPAYAYSPSGPSSRQLGPWNLAMVTHPD